MNKVLNKLFSGKIKWLTSLILIIMIGFTFQTLSQNSKNGYEIFSVGRGDLKQEVMVSGVIKSKTDVDLAFERSGTVSYVNKNVNDYVYAGEIIIALKNDTEKASVNEAKALLTSKEARFKELSIGSRPEEIYVKKLVVDSEKQALTNYYNSTAEKINSAFNYADNAVNKLADNLFSNGNSNNPQLTFNVINQQTKNDVISLRTQITNILADFNVINNTALSLNLSEEENENYLNQVKLYLIKTQEFLTKLTEALNYSAGLSDADLATYKTNINTGRVNINTALSAITTLIENINSQKITIAKTEGELELLKLGATESVLLQAKSDILQAKAKVQSAEANLAKTIITAPISGIVSKIEAVKGELVSAGAIVAKVIGNNNYIVEANVPETDLAKIKVENPAEITLDAFGEERLLKGRLVEIEPAERLIDGVSTYKIKVALDEKIDQTNIKPGMTANITLVVANKKNTLIVPTQALKEIDGKTFVTVLNNNQKEEVEVLTGLQAYSKIEILSGLSENDQILIPTK